MGASLPSKWRSRAAAIPPFETVKLTSATDDGLTRVDPLQTVVAKNRSIKADLSGEERVARGGHPVKLNKARLFAFLGPQRDKALAAARKRRRGVP
jgi:hypothetical protein